VSARAVTHVEAWGLHVPEDLGGRLLDVTPAEGCVDEQCNHYSHAPAAPRRRWEPEGTLVELGTDTWPRLTETWYWYPPSAAFLVLEEPAHEHAFLDEVDVEDAPQWVLDALADYHEGVA
jgi:hypothetical protein